ncbi:tonB-system energizer ExbB [Limoniibacter endophyticus]|uniref:Biopolymer transport protein ExbB n=1 Tax=Limoniibacter endophyticus TaxID=1565040 RepID=A0A8J3GGD3_9HYPH|nr:tonB-system energizer ExbB [Limoniibacter endophyticus]GHC67963.1 tonB-system energizer ExbB [Limoniibacter endophyticus]
MSGNKADIRLRLQRALLHSIPALVLAGFVSTAAFAQDAQSQTQNQAPALAEPTQTQSATPPAAQPVEPETQPAAPQQTPAPAVSEAAPVQNESAQGPVDVAQPGEVPAETLPHDLSPWGMFMAADWVVKGVMIGLIIASLLTWTIWLAKSLEIAAAKIRIGKVLRVVEDARSLQDATETLAGSRGTGAIMIKATNEEVDLSRGALSKAGAEGLKERVTSRLSRIEAFSGRKMTKGTGILATIGSVAPFVGLFGTVWGIMNSFISISEAQTTNLAVVAPGIAEALLATAIGLVAAIPAVVFYNVFARSIAGYRHTMGDVSAAIERLVSRDLDYGAYTHSQRVSVAAE